MVITGTTNSNDWCNDSVCKTILRVFHEHNTLCGNHHGLHKLHKTKIFWTSTAYNDDIANTFVIHEVSNSKIYLGSIFNTHVNCLGKNQHVH